MLRATQHSNFELEFDITNTESGKKARLEGTTCYVTADDIRKNGIDPTSKEAHMLETINFIYENCTGAAKTPSADIATEQVIEYDLWLAHDFPSDSNAIIGQFHGRPDPRIFHNPKTNETRRLSTTAAYAACTHTAKNSRVPVGHALPTSPYETSCSEGNVTAGPFEGWLYKQGGYPPLTFGLSGKDRQGNPPMWYVFGRSDDRLFVPKGDCGFDASSPTDWPTRSCPGGVHEQVHGLWRAPFSTVPLGQWISFAWRIHWSAYARNGGSVVSNGTVHLSIDHGNIANVSWTGPVGRHDDGRAPFFKLGVYDPSGSTATMRLRFKNFTQSFRILPPMQPRDMAP